MSVASNGPISGTRTRTRQLSVPAASTTGSARFAPLVYCSVVQHLPGVVSLGLDDTRLQPCCMHPAGSSTLYGRAFGSKPLH